MHDSSLAQIITLLEKANSNGIHLSFDNHELVVKFQKGKHVEAALLHEIKLNKSMLMDYFTRNMGASNELFSRNPLKSFDRLNYSRLPLSFSQERLWFADQLEGSVQYHIPAVLKINGKPDLNALEHALKDIVDRHEVLRTVIREAEGRPYQVILEKGTWKLNTIRVSEDLGGLMLRGRIEGLIAHPFHLSEDHMLRAHLVLHENECILVVVLHHIASDGWSVPILVRELISLYKAHAAGRAALLPPLDIQYADYAIWQREYLKGDVLSDKLDYWKRQLAGASLMNLQTDYVRPARMGIKGGVVQFLVDKRLASQLQSLSREQGGTLFMTLLATFNVLLYRYTGQYDICVSSPVAGRQQQEVEKLIGFFINNLVLRSSLTGQMRFTALLQQVKLTVLQAFEHQEAPFEKVVEAIGLERDRSRNPLADVKFALHNVGERGALDLGEGISLTLEGSSQVTAQVDVSMDVTELAQGLEVSITYSTALFQKDTIVRMAGHYERLLKEIAANPHQKIAELSMLSATEQVLLLQSFNNHAAPFPADKTIVDLFAQQASVYPDNIAVAFNNSQLTYRELHERSSQLGQFLSRLGIKKGSLVPLLVERGLDMIVGIFGILKAGAAYVPVDPAYPEERIAYMLDDAGAKLVVSNSDCAQYLPVMGNRTVVQLDRDWEKISENPVSLPETAPGAGDLAYVMYTSGSTGKPKGVMIEHSGVVNLVYSQKAPLRLKPGIVVLQFASMSFDASCYEIFCTLLHGGQLVLAAKELLLDATALHNLINSHKIELVTLPPSYQFVIDENLHSLKTVVSAGEALNASLAVSIMNRGIRLINAYGPTENTVCAVLSEQPVQENGSVTIGKPVSNVQVFILDNDGNLLPVGCTGELHTGGAQVARGYLNLPELTAQKFIPDPFNKAAGARLYKTGDLARWLPDGTIGFAGRMDSQVKIRGYRIEPEEIERVLQLSPEVEQAVVMVRADAGGNQYLAGYVVPSGTFDRRAVFAYLKRKLPDYMLPAHLVELKSLPLTANGKIDKKALPETGEATPANDYLAPRNAIEQQIAAIWKELLGMEQVSMNDNFFDLGGHSLQSVRLVSAIRKQLLAEISIDDVFQYPTVAGMAALLAGQLNKVNLLPSIIRRQRPSLIPLSFSQERLWFIHQLEGSVQYHVPSVIRLKGRLNTAALNHALNTIVNRHEALRTVFDQIQGEPYQRILEAGGWRLETLDGAAYKDDNTALAFRIQALINVPFDISNEHMIRVHLMQLAEDDHVFIMTIHHLSFDGWSRTVIIKELTCLYNDYLAGAVTVLPELTVQYADYSIWQREHFSGELLAEKLAYWKGQLEGTGYLNLPTDFQRPAVQSSNGAAIQATIGKEITTRINRLSRQQDATLFMTLLAAFKVLLFRYSGQDDICVGVPIAGRHQHEVEKLIGFFINMLVMRSDLRNNPPFVDLLQQVKETALKAFSQQDVPFDKVVEAVVTERNRSRSPLFQVSFALQNTPDVPGISSLDLHGLEILPIIAKNPTAKYDLVFTVEETAEGLYVNIEYRTDLYLQETIQRMVGHYRQLLESIADDPQQKIGDLNLLGASERRRLLEEFSGGNLAALPAATPANTTFIHLFEQQAALTPHLSAVISAEGSLSYHQLNERAGHFARQLISSGVGCESLVPLCMQKGANLVVAILAIFKAGGAYVPIDPRYPSQRIAFMLADTAATVVVTDKACAPAVAAALGSSTTTIVELDGQWQRHGDSGTDPGAAPALKGHHLAYVIYTSGSTGTPKGVMVTHQNLLHYLSVNAAAYLGGGAGVGSGTFVHLSCSFDASVTALFMPLLQGSSLVIGCGEGVEAFEDVLFMRHAPYRFLKLTPAHLPLLQLAVAAGGGVMVTQRLVVGGEALEWHQVQWLYELGMEVEVINEYGPTEATVGCCRYSFSTAQPKPQGQPIPIGRPMAGTRLYILDDQGGLCPVGVVGELYIGGAGVARGYLKGEGLEVERFVCNGYGVEGERVYRTGDMVRWHPEGDIGYIGRRDQQVKVKGYRIELGEIEQVLSGCVGLREGVVLYRRGDLGEEGRLECYVVGEVDEEGVMGYLGRRLPWYMVPSKVVVMEVLPLTVNGKVDRQRLLLEGEGREKAASGAGYVGPRNAIEEQLAQIWQELLEVERAGVHDNFFELGGDSIITIQAISRARQLGYALQVGDLFEYQTIAQLAQVISKREELNAAKPEEQEPLTGGSGLLPVQQWFFQKKNAAVSWFNQSILLEISKEVEVPALLQAIKALVRHHDALRFAYKQAPDGWKQIYHTYEGGIETVQLLSSDEDALAKETAQHANRYQQSLDIEKGELIRAVWMQTSGEVVNNRLLLIIHHLAVDGVSWRILLEDLDGLLSGIKNSHPVSLPAKTSAYRDWYDALEQYGKSDRLKGQKNYWQRLVQHYVPLPADFGAGEASTIKHISACTVKLSRQQTHRLLHEVPKVYHTEINDILLAALSFTLCKWTGKNQLMVGLEGHGRENLVKNMDTSRTVGWFTNIYPVLLEVDVHKDESDLIKRVKEQFRRVPAKGIGYNVLRYLHKDPNLQEKSWDIVFNYFGQTDNVTGKSKWLHPAKESSGDNICPDYPMEDKLTINGIVKEGQLVTDWFYSTKDYNPETIRQLSAACQDTLEALIAHCTQRMQIGPVFTPSDYGLAAEVDYRELDGFLQTPAINAGDHKGIDGLYRLSGLQQGMLFHSLYNNHTGAYVEQLSCRLVNLQVDHFVKSWKHLFGVHSILRSSFHYDAFSIPVQVVYRHVEPVIAIKDLRTLNPEAQQVAISGYEEADRQNGFNLSAPPLMRIVLMWLNENSYHMLWTHHHILLDGWSMQVIMEALLSHYGSLLYGKPVQGAAEDRYEDYIRYLERRNREDEAVYWRSYLKGVMAGSVLPFITSKTERNKGIGEYRQERLLLDPETSGRIVAFAQHARITVNTVMQGVWAYLLHRYTNRPEVTYGIIVSGRPDDLVNIERRVGMYINTIPLHTCIAYEQTIAGWLLSLQQEQIKSREYQYSSLTDIQGWAGVQGDLFDSLLVFENYPVSKVIASGNWAVQVEQVQVKEHANYPLSITVGTMGDLSIRFSYNSGLLQTATVSSIRGHFEQVLRQFIRKEVIQVKDIALLDQAEHQLVTTAFNDTGAPYRRDKSIVDLFNTQAAKTPDAVAVVAGDLQLTYAALNRRAGRLAGYLSGKGVKKDRLVPVCINRSAEMIVAILGILKAGGAYVPIEPDFPKERIAYMLGDTASSVAITSSTCRHHFPASYEGEVIALDNDGAFIGEDAAGWPAVPPGPEDLAYVIYTSGSTGRPKGVMMEHRAVVNLVEALNSRIYHVYQGQQLRIMLMASFVFDGSVKQIFGALLNGHSLYMVSEQVKKDPAMLHAYMCVHNLIDISDGTPGLFGLLTAYSPMLYPVKHFILGGEVLSKNIIRSFYQQEGNGPVKISNVYGPTECCVDVTCYTISQDNYERYDFVPIGKPLQNIKIYILNHHLKPAPVGVTGEMYIGGDCLARGYLNQPALTAEKFIPDIFSQTENGRLYRTGDLARWLPDGNIAYVGRVDDQVKIRGHRIEPEEVRHVVKQCALVRESAVVTGSDSDGNQQLLCYVVPHGSFDRNGILHYLRNQLPDYMIPALVIEIDALPITANGKVDKGRLPPPHPLQAGDLVQQVLGRNEAEKKITAVWAQVLNVPEAQLGIDNNFFDLGGNSLLIIKARQLLNRAFDRDFAVADLFRLPTIRALSAFMNNENNHSQHDFADNAIDSLDVMEQTLQLINETAHVND